MITADYIGEGGVRNGKKCDEVICERTLVNIEFIYIRF